MRTRGRIAAALVLAALGLVVATSPAQARDTNWPCPGCFTSHR